MRKYEQTHGHIVFSLDMSETRYDTWMLLGAVESKCKHLSGIPLRPEKQDEINKISFTRGIHATTAIEGNTLGLDEVGSILHMPSVKTMRSKAYQRKEVENVGARYNAVIREIQRTGTCKIDASVLMGDNKSILDGLELTDGIIPGQIRTYDVGVAAYKAPPAEDCQYLLSRLFEWLSLDWGFAEHPMIEGILKALMLHLYVAWIHPFGDGNGRTARLAEFRMLMRAGIPLNAAHLLTSHYNDTRAEYYMAFSDSMRFIRYAVAGFVDALDTQIAEILNEQIEVTWSNYIHSAFNGRLTDVKARQRDLLIELSKFERVPIDGWQMYLGETMRKTYGAISARTSSRDLGALESGNYIIRKDGFIIPQKDMMKAFMPIRAANPNLGG